MPQAVFDHTALDPTAIINSAPTALVMVDSTGRIVLVNAETEFLLGQSRAELIGRLVDELVPERFRGKHEAHRRRFHGDPAKRGMSARPDLFALKNDGTEIPVEVLLNPIRTSDGFFVVAALIDLTERRRAEEALKHANTALEKSNMELQQFAYVASHDLQTPLRGIAGFAQMLQSDYRNKLSDEADQHLERIVEGTKRLQQMIGDLLSFARVESRARRFEIINLGEVFEDTVALLGASIEDAGADVTSDALPSVECDRAQISQLLQNLIGNAVKYRGDAPPKVHVSAQSTGGEWTITVADNGIGIEAKHHDKIFEVFRRLHGQGKYPGTGIGLAVCRRIVDRHGGRIWVESDAGKGSTFYFTIPKRRSEAA